MKLDHLGVLYPGKRRYTLGERVTVLPLVAVAEGGIEALFPKRKSK